MLLELLGGQPTLAVAREDRLDRALLVNLVDDDDACPLHLGLGESVDRAMQVLACRYAVTLLTHPSARGPLQLPPAVVDLPTGFIAEGVALRERAGGGVLDVRDDAGAAVEPREVEGIELAGWTRVVLSGSRR